MRITIHGVVQGVGFRPFVYRLAHRLGLDGSVANNGDGVRIHVGGGQEALDRFVAALHEEAPPVARIVRIAATPAEEPEAGFRILTSDRVGRPSTQIAPDIAICADCLAEIHDPNNRRHRYPFTNCTNCGPRFSIVERVPYDRANTSMRVFPLCPQCDREFHDPLDRRFHAQPNACPVCGPRLSWHDREGVAIAGDPLTLAAQALADGQVVAIRGLGGFHLAVDAAANEAVARLRERKHRPSKPLAVMVRDLDAATRLCLVSPEEARLLTSPERPIVLLARRDPDGLAANVAPGLGILGVMLAYAPLHHLLLGEPQAPAVLVMTSGNRSDEPICTGNDEALHRLGGLADGFLLHDREIVTRVDDSVARVMAGRPRLIRRARGYAPLPVLLRQPTHDILACGAEMKNSFCLVRGQEAYLSQHIGELTGPAAYDFFRESVAHLQEVLEVEPPQVACDQHPDYLSTRFARGRDVPCRAVQHHHAHAGAVMAEHNLAGPVLSLILDGTGHGGDGTVFGGEIYRADRAGFQRLGRLAHLPLPGGDMAAREPWRMALAWLHQGGYPDLTGTTGTALDSIASESRRLVGAMMARGFNCPWTSSCGRLFDAVSALLGLCLVSDHEGQAAMLLEHQAGLAPAVCSERAYPVHLRHEGEVVVIDSVPLGTLLRRDLATGASVPSMARRFHDWIGEAALVVLDDLRRKTGLATVVLGGGCMQNKVLLEILHRRLEENGFAVYAGEQVPMNDGGIALGQAFIGGHSCV